MKKGILLSILLSAALLLTACGGGQSKTEAPRSGEAGSGFQAQYDWVLPDFNYVNQDGEEIGKKDLLGEAWLANFVFTNCTTVCSPMTANMAKVQRELKEAGLDNTIVSFSVDPERDTPPVLKEFSAKFEADLSHWHFLTGYQQEEVGALAKAFKTLAEKEEGTDQFIHSTKIFLIDKDGMIVKGYDGLDVPFEEIVADLKALK
ncbi:SCO family protein [Bacillus benzoevorans]|uniref:Protein SCO1/2 n=1 Tax=Bacillus benzoevorans TaxID=1456 RepID=A0A7X0HWH0_9BACI|nr:SCO family protein [Bacillus benzoevorans]MBB6446900.1 protein SCO1/2 [Bacillus benzoevorans]